jgi:hypothetical protein
MERCWWRMMLEMLFGELLEKLHSRIARRFGGLSSTKVGSPQ